MSRSIFGWSLPPGTTQRHIDELSDDGVTQLQSDILDRLESASIPQSYCDQIMKLIAMGESERQNIDDAKLVDLLADDEAERMSAMQDLDDEGGGPFR